MKTISLLNRHLIIPADIAQKFVEKENHVLVVYYAQHKKLMLAPASDAIFKQLHKTSMLMVKEKNLAGDKSVSLEEILIDHDLDDEDRPLDYTWDATNIIQVYL
jgi:hypothetical protein